MEKNIFIGQDGVIYPVEIKLSEELKKSSRITEYFYRIDNSKYLTDDKKLLVDNQHPTLEIVYVLE